MFRICVLVLFLGVVATAAPPDQPLRSTAIAAQLTEALTAQKLDAIATRDPDEPDRFVAAIFYPNAQLLVISARTASPDILSARLLYKQYRDTYADLQGSPIKGTSTFFQDMKADGLSASRDQVADVLFEGNGTTMVFDSDWKKKNLSERDYMAQLQAADERYSRMLTLLLAQIKGT